MSREEFVSVVFRLKLKTKLWTYSVYMKICGDYFQLS